MARKRDRWRPWLFGTQRRREPVTDRRSGSRCRLCYAIPCFIVFMALTLPCAMALKGIPEGVWLMDGKVALQIFGCDNLLCGRIVWLAIPRDLVGQLNLDRHNPDPALRHRRLCGLTILWNLHGAGGNRWNDGWLYNPDDGKTYRVSAVIRSADLIVARVYVGLPFFGETKTLVRVPHGKTEGWC